MELQGCRLGSAQLKNASCLLPLGSALAFISSVNESEGMATQLCDTTIMYEYTLAVWLRLSLRVPEGRLTVVAAVHAVHAVLAVGRGARGAGASRGGGRRIWNEDSTQQGWAGPQGMLGFRGPSNGFKRHSARLRGEQNRGARGLRIEECKDEAVGSFALHSNR